MNRKKDITVSILLIINPTKFKMFRLERANVMLTVDKIKVMPYRNQGEQQEYSYIDFGRAFETMFYPAGIDTPINEAYKSVYGESYYKRKTLSRRKNDANDTGNRESARKMKPELIDRCQEKPELKGHLRQQKKKQNYQTQRATFVMEKKAENRTH